MVTLAKDRLEVAARAIRSLPTDAPHRAAALHDRHYATILELLTPRIRYLIGSYGLAALRDEAEHACALGVLRALRDYTPDRSRFTTYVNRVLHGELRALRRHVAGTREAAGAFDRAVPDDVQNDAAARLSERTLDEMLGRYATSSAQANGD